jgi:hypothetical protein
VGNVERANLSGRASVALTRVLPLLVSLLLLASGASGASAPLEASVFVSPAGADTNPCTAPAPCASFQRAYQTAAPGAVIEVAAGSYPYQRLSSLGKDQPRVVFRPAAGAAVTVDYLDIGQSRFSARPPSHVEIQGMTFAGGWAVWDGADDIVLRNVFAPTFQVIGGSNILVLGGGYGPCQAPACGGAMRLSGSNVLVDSAAIHDITSTNLVTDHVDGMFIRGCQGCVVKNSKFYGNMIDDIRIQNCCPGSDPPNQNITIENNWFAAPLQGDGVTTRADAINVDTATPGLVIRNNSFVNSGALFTNADAGAGATIVNNLMTNFTCVSGVTYSHNVYRPAGNGYGAKPCSPTDKQAGSFGYQDVAAFDLHLDYRSPALAYGDRGNCPQKDIDGRARIVDVVGCDVGADQRRDTWACWHGKKKGNVKSVLVSGIWLATGSHPDYTPGQCKKK